MKCGQRPYSLPDYARGILPENESASVAEHVRRCAVCSAEVGELQKLFGALNGYSPAPPPDSYWSSLLPRIHERLERLPSRPRVAEFIPRLMPVIVTLFALIFLPRMEFFDASRETQQIHAIIDQLSESALQEIAQGTEAENGFETGNLMEGRDDIASADRVILQVLLEEGEDTVTYSGIDEINPESGLTDEEAAEIVTRLEHYERN